MGDLLGFEGYMNTTTPFALTEHHVDFKSSRQYLDFHPGNNYKDKCQYPRFWLETGFPVGKDVTDRMNGCYDSEFDQVRMMLGVVEGHETNSDPSMVTPKPLVSSQIGNVNSQNSLVSRIVFENGCRPFGKRFRDIPAS